MIRRSVSSGTRRPASPRGCCARSALALFFVLSCLSLPTGAQAPEPQPADATEVKVELTAAPITTDDTAPDLLDAKAAFADAKTATPTPAPPPKKKSPPAPRESDNLEAALERRGDLNLHGLSLNSALFTISEQWNINIVAGDVQGTVNGVFKQAPLREILDSILLSSGYNYRVVGKSLVVSSVADLGQINPFFQTATIQVHSADIDEVVEGAKLLNTPQGQVKALKSVRSIVVLDFPDRVKMIREFVAALDGASSGRGAADSRFGLPYDVAHFRTQYIRAIDAQTALAAVMSKDGRITCIEKEDRLVITDYAENVAMAEKVLERIDRPRPQVRITALIYDISLQDIERLGLNFNGIAFNSDGDSGFGVAVSESAFKSVTFDDGGLAVERASPGNIAFGVLSRHINISAVLHALQQANDARLLADPNVAVLDNEQALFESVREIPIQQLTETAQGGNIGTTAFREAGITLTVTPKIASDCTISMEVSPVFSRLVDFDPNGQPIIDRREAKTILRVANRQTVVIGGLRQREDIGEFSGIPYLKDMKYVGRLFRMRNVNVRESELVVFICPEIIDEADEPHGRQKMAEDTIRCRLDQIPEGEGCPPCCRRLPPEMMDEESYEVAEPALDEEATDESLPTTDDLKLPPLAANEIPSAEFQFGLAGRAAHVQTLVAEGRLRRLPTVTDAGPQLAEQEPKNSQMFPAPLAPPDGDVIRTADGASAVLR